MHPQLPAILKCIFCGKEGLNLSPTTRIINLDNEEVVEEGTVLCLACKSSFPVEAGIINFLPRKLKNIRLGTGTNHLKPIAWGYERFWRPRALSILAGRPWPPEEELSTIIELLDLKRPDKITTHNGLVFYLDQACSSGFYAREIARSLASGRLPTPGSSIPGHVVALDFSWPMLLEARGFIKKEGLSGKISLVRAKVEDLPFISQAFAGIACGGSLNEFPDVPEALSEARRVIAPEGKGAYMVQMQAKTQPGKSINQFITLTSGIKFFSAEKLKNLYGAAGFKINWQQAEGLINISGLSPV